MKRTAVEVLGLVTFIAAGCAAGIRHDNLPRRYQCEGTTVMRTVDALEVDGAKANLLQRDEDGDRFGASSGGDAGEYAEYDMPRDGLLDATVRRYRVTQSPDRSSWPLRDRRTCVAEGGYTDALARYMFGGSIDYIAKQLAIDENEARRRIRKALARIRCRYYGGGC